MSKQIKTSSNWHYAINSLTYCTVKDEIIEQLLTTKSIKVQKVALSRLIELSYTIDDKTLLKIAKTKKYSRIWPRIIEFLPKNTSIKIYKSMITYCSHQNIIRDLCFSIIDHISSTKRTRISNFIYAQFPKPLYSPYFSDIMIKIFNYITLSDEKVEHYLDYSVFYPEMHIIHDQLIDYIINRDVSYVNTIIEKNNFYLHDKIINKLNPDKLMQILIIQAQKKLIWLPIKQLPLDYQLKFMTEYGELMYEFPLLAKSIITQFKDEDICNLIMLYSNTKLGQLARDVLRSR